MKANHDKCHLLLSTQVGFNIQIANFKIKPSEAKKRLGINLDKNLKFYIHVEYSYIQKTQCSRKNSKLYGTV